MPVLQGYPADLRKHVHQRSGSTRPTPYSVAWLPADHASGSVLVCPGNQLPCCKQGTPAPVLLFLYLDFRHSIPNHWIGEVSYMAAENNALMPHPTVATIAALSKRGLAMITNITIVTEVAGMQQSGAGGRPKQSPCRPCLPRPSVPTGQRSPALPAAHHQAPHHPHHPPLHPSPRRVHSYS